MNWTVGDIYSVKIGGPDGGPEDIVLLDCGVSIKKDSVAQYTKTAGVAPTVSLITPTLVYDTLGRYDFGGFELTAGAWTIIVDDGESLSFHDGPFEPNAAAPAPGEPMAGVTFDPALPTLRDHIRLALGDTDITAGLVADATIDTKLGLFGYAEALAQLAEGLISSFGQRPSKYGESGGVTTEWADRIDAWKDLVKAARSGTIAAPTLTRTPRSGMALQQTTAQAMTTSTARTVADVPTIMEGFRAD